MKKVLNIFFVTLGVIFLIILVYLFFFSPIKIDTIVNLKNSATTTEENNSTDSSSNIDKNPLLTPAQEKTLETLGVDPSKLPTSITPEMEACFVAKLGLARVNEIKAGSSPTVSDFFAARSCI